ncbi:hypothetical protein SAMN04487969_101115 [Paenibacillus algorifonticola]|uniref:DUF7167 domain-containing protein n=1 Tax=Paenibacillus algorifonticola TaxID=684063 RepID=A0A1I1Y0B6_9BACL|nr:hypothetical protein [Paenibacillus algorifonticola]SFE11210.1 hypothetical protein SAMN04487969_101115 [Paenibacillus algorifonticola]
MKVKWTMSNGYPGAIQSGTIEIAEEELEGLSDDERESYIGEAVWEDAVQYVDTSWEIEE